MILFLGRYLIGVLKCHQTKKKKIQSSGNHLLRRSNCHCCAVPITTGKKIDSLLRLEKKVLVVCLAGARLLLRPEKKFQSSVWQVRNQYYFYHGSDLREIIQFLHEIESFEFECNKFALVLVQIDFIHIEHSNCISST